jgi:hypothetical protein
MLTRPILEGSVDMDWPPLKQISVSKGALWYHFPDGAIREVEFDDDVDIPACVTSSEQQRQDLTNVQYTSLQACGKLRARHADSSICYGRRR